MSADHERRIVAPNSVLLERLRVLAYAVEGEASTYRAVMRVFAEAKARYVVQMRPADVLDELAAGGYVVELADGSISSRARSRRPRRMRRRRPRPSRP